MTNQPNQRKVKSVSNFMIPTKFKCFNELEKESENKVCLVWNLVECERILVKL